MRIVLAFSCFFRLLFGMKLSPKAAAYLPDGAARALPAADAEEPARNRKEKTTPIEVPVLKPKPANVAQHHRDGALALLALLQREGRLVDFLREGIDDYDDADIGAAVRDIHRGCKKAIDEHVTLEPIMPGAEDDAVTVQAGFDPGEVRLSGKVAGDPPFKGVLRHHGWRATKAELPMLSDNIDRRVIAPAEIEVG
jgi:hypothetical protein